MEGLWLQTYTFTRPVGPELLNTILVANGDMIHAVFFAQTSAIFSVTNHCQD